MIKVLEIGHIVAGPTAGLILSDLGYDVIKIERPGDGDIARRLTGSSSGAFPFYNRNKKSLTVDMSSEEGKKVFLNLAEQSGVIIDNLGYGAMDRLGLSYEVISKRNPKIIYLSMKGYGKGVYEKRKSLDYPIEVHSGLAYMTGLTGKPMRVGGSLVDMSAAMFGVIAVLNAMIEMRESGVGKYIDIGLFESSVFLMGQHIATYQINQRELKPINEEGFAWAIYDFFPTREGRSLFIAVTTDNQWRDFCNGLELGVCGDASLDRNEKRFEKRDMLYRLISEKTSKIAIGDLMNRLEKMNIAFAVLNKPWDMLNDPQASAKMVTETYENRTIRVPVTPTGGIMRGNPPGLGENTDEILQNLGYSSKEIQEMKMKGVI
ncbi:MAG: CoA transferase [Candidatus Thermoplasmatota archaeon]|nr:CoA transferase [Candidatus Thermoplasmatota archaeon]